MSSDRRYGVVGSLGIKAPCVVATTGPITLSGTQTIDGIALVSGDRCLVKDQVNQATNGVYVVDTGVWTRDLDFDGPLDVVQGTLIPIAQGAVNGNNVFQLTAPNPITIGKSNLTFTINVSLTNYFAQLGAGAVNTTLQNRGRLTIYATDYGAIGDNGTTDNYAAFTAALAYLGTLANGGILRVPGGVNNRYVFKAQGANYPTLYIPSNVYVVSDPDVYFIVSASGLANSGVHIYGTCLFTNVGWNTTGAKNLGIIGGNFKSANATSGSTGNGGLIAFKNCLRPRLSNVKLLEVLGCARYQQSFCYGAIIDNVVVDYEISDAAHGSSWSFEDGIRIGSGSINTTINVTDISSGDDCIALSNETSECQDAFTSPIDSRIPASNVNGANITGVFITNFSAKNRAGHALRIYGLLSTGTINKVRVKHINSSTNVTDGTIIPVTDTAGTNVFDIQIDGGTLDAAGVTYSGGSPSLIQGAPDMHLMNLTILNGAAPAVYGIALGTRGKAINCKISSPVANDQIYINSADCVVEKNWLSEAGVSGIHIDSAASHTRLIGNRIPASTGAAITETSGASYTYAAGNDVQGATACSIANNTGSVYEKNPGYNVPTPAAMTPPATTVPYTTGVSTETLTVGTGTAVGLAVHIGSFDPGFATGAFTLPPHTSITLFYSSGTPVMTKIVH